MQISGIEQEIKIASKPQISQQVIQLINDLARLPASQQLLPIDKILFSQHSAIQLNIGNHPLLAKISIPLNTAEQIAALKLQPFNLQLNIKNQQIELILTPSNTNTGNHQTSATAAKIVLVFNQADVTNHKQLLLSQSLLSKNLLSQNKTTSAAQNQIITSNTRPAISNTAITSTAITSTAITSARQTETSNQPQSITLQNYIKDFLKNRSTHQSPVAQNLTQLIRSSENIIKKLQSDINHALAQNQSNNNVQKESLQKTANNLGKENSLRNQQQKNNLTIKSTLRETSNIKSTDKSNSFQPLNQLDILELISIGRKQSKDPLLKNFSGLLNEINNLKNTNDLSSATSALQIKHKVQASGGFYENQLNKNFALLAESKANTAKRTISSLSEQSENKPDQLNSQQKTSEKNLTNKSALQKSLLPTVDLKQSSLKIKSLVDNLISLLTQAKTHPLTVSRLINHVTQQIASHISQNNAQEKLLPLSISQQSNATQVALDELIQSPRLKNFLSNQSLVEQLKQHKISTQDHHQLIENQLRTLKILQQEILKALNKIETNQLLSLNQQTNKNDFVSGQYFLVDLPIFKDNQVESFELLFQSPVGQNKAKKIWTVTIKFDLQPLGPMFAKVSLQGSRISSHIFAQDPQTAKLLGENIQLLQESLFLAGLDIDEIKGQLGKVPEKLIENSEYILDLRV